MTIFHRKGGDIMKNRRFFVAESLEYGEFFPVPAKHFSTHGSWVKTGSRVQIHANRVGPGKSRTFTFREAEAFCREMNRD